MLKSVAEIPAIAKDMTREELERVVLKLVAIAQEDSRSELQFSLLDIFDLEG